MRLLYCVILLGYTWMGTGVRAKVEHNSNVHKEYVAKKGGHLEQAAAAGNKDGMVDNVKLCELLILFTISLGTSAFNVRVSRYIIWFDL